MEGGGLAWLSGRRHFEPTCPALSYRQVGGTARQGCAAFRTMVPTKPTQPDIVVIQEGQTVARRATRQSVSWPTSPGWYWLRDGDGNKDIVHCLEIHGELKVYYTKFHREYDYDKIDIWMTQEDFYEYGDCQFVRVNDECPWA